MRTLILLALVGCAKSEPAPTSGSAEPSASASVFDIEGFCEATMAVGRACEGDDELLEGNKIGLCTTTLRESGVALDPALAPPCIQAVKADQGLPDRRTLQHVVARHEPCRKLLSRIGSIAKVKPTSPGTTTAGAPCKSTDDCAPGLYCTTPGDAGAPVCTAKKKAGESCIASEECLGRCSTQAGRKCVAYCGSG